MDTIKSFSVVFEAVEAELQVWGEDGRLSMPTLIERVTARLTGLLIKDIKGAVIFAIHNHPMYDSSRGMNGGIQPRARICARELAKKQKESSNAARQSAKDQIAAKVSEKILESETELVSAMISSEVSDEDEASCEVA